MRSLGRNRWFQVFVVFWALLLVPHAIAFSFYAISGPQPPWWEAKLETTGIAPKAEDHDAAVVQIYGARAYRWRGVFAVHMWIAFKEEAAAAYERYDVIGWNLIPLTKNRSAVDGDWYGRLPDLIYDARGDKATRLIPEIRRAIEAYPYGGKGEYEVWPGPNSNTFIAHIARSVPEMKVALPSHAVGKDFGESWFTILPTPSNTGYQISFRGYGGVAFGAVEGIELHVLGQTLGIDFLRPALKLPALGRIGLSRTSG